MPDTSCGRDLIQSLYKDKKQARFLWVREKLKIQELYSKFPRIAHTIRMLGFVAYCKRKALQDNPFNKYYLETSSRMKDLKEAYMLLWEIGWWDADLWHKASNLEGVFYVEKE